ncbi:hypothetical protein [Luteibacter sp.]|uniref:hypothetical protein n=1 Tax=Luteibacter sp. TaxID=1886636 RepID=UPI00280A0905|nr:hypothetical protein [Luteibacter sp.]MDQ8048082.1 hypothetical protein [Luteibacter sp.]
MSDNAEAVDQAEPKKDVQGPPERVTLDALLEKVAEAKRLGSVNSASGALGEELAIYKHGWTRRPVGKEMANLLAALKQNGIDIQRTSFDALLVPDDVELELGTLYGLAERIKKATFIEIKSARRKNMPADFTEFFLPLPTGKSKRPWHSKTNTLWRWLTLMSPSEASTSRTFGPFSTGHVPQTGSCPFNWEAVTLSEEMKTTTPTKT